MMKWYGRLLQRDEHKRQPLLQVPAITSAGDKRNASNSKHTNSGTSRVVSAPASTLKPLVHRALKSWWVRLGLAALVVLLGLVTVGLSVLPAWADHHATQQATFYGANNAAVQSAVNAAQWPQQKSNWCGVATVAAIAQFRGKAVSQQNVADYLNSSAAVSMWGTPPHSSTTWGPAFKADIAGDVGTDPRSLAAGLSAEAQGHYHQLIDTGSNYEATLHLAGDLVRTQEAISVTVYHGLHSVLVSAVEATANPVTDPGSILGLEVWDPGYGIPNGNIQPAQEVLVPLNTWLTASVYWASSYNANYFGTIAADPDPGVGPYTFDPTHQENVHLWIGHYVYLRQDAASDPSVNVSPDWPFTVSGPLIALIAGAHGELPTGYSGPQVALPAVVTLSDTSIDGPALWTASTYQPAVHTSAWVSVLAWTGTDKGHSLWLETSTDGIHYTNHLGVGQSSFTRPAVLVLLSYPTNIVLLAWAGTDTNHSLNVMYDAYGVRKIVTLGDASASAPSLTYFAGQVWVAWTGTDANHTLNVQALGSQGVTPGVKTTLSGNTSNQAPQLATDRLNGKLLVSWVAAGTNQLTFATSSDGTTWTNGPAVPIAETSHFTPALAATDPMPTPTAKATYAWCWAGNDLEHVLSITQSSTLTSWTGPVTTILGASLSAPQLGYISARQQLLLAWTSPDVGNHLMITLLPAQG